jgi:hypothetical protein
MRFKKGDCVIYKAFAPSSVVSSFAYALEGEIGFVKEDNSEDCEHVLVDFECKKGVWNVHYVNLSLFNKEPDWRI